MRFNSIKFEVSVLHTLILGIILIAFSGALYFISNAFFQEIDHMLKLKAQAIGNTIQTYMEVSGSRPEDLKQAVDKTIGMKSGKFFQLRSMRISRFWVKHSNELELDKDYINFVSENGALTLSSPNLDQDLRQHFLEDIQLPNDTELTYRKLKYNQKTIRIINYPFETKDGKKHIIQVGSAEDPIARLLHDWLFTIIIIIPIMLLLTSFVGRLLAARILEPVEEITAMARKITLQDLSGRVKSKNFGVEMQGLIGAFNDMISRLEKSFKHIEEFSSHVAHELKTPLTIIKGEAELTLMKDRTPEEYKRALAINMEEAERMLKTVDDLLLLTKLDYQPEVFKFEPISIFDFFREIYTQSKILTAKRAVSVGLRMDEQDSMIMGDRLHLRRLFLNIIDNAIKFTPPGGRISITIRCDHKTVICFISDTGVGITKENLPKIFKRFFRSDSSIHGTGLGLNIAKTIALIHQGDIQVESELGVGTTFKIFLPVIPSSQTRPVKDEKRSVERTLVNSPVENE